jgi:hypothetical protein
VLSDEVAAIVTPHLLQELSGVLERDKFRRWVSLADARAFVAALSDKADLRADAGSLAGPPAIRMMTTWLRSPRRPAP